MGGNPKVGGFSNLEYYRRGQRIGNLMPYGTCGVLFAYHARVIYPQSRQYLSAAQVSVFCLKPRGPLIFSSVLAALWSSKTIWVT